MPEPTGTWGSGTVSTLSRRLDALRRARSAGATGAGPSRPDPGNVPTFGHGATSGHLASGHPAAAAGAAPPLVAVDRAGTAERLAASLGGSVLPLGGGRVVEVRTEVELPLPAERLAALPYPIDPERPLVCLDTETTGLGTAAGTLVFMVGLGRWTGSRFEVDQLVLPDHADETALLATLTAALPCDAWLVTYNGRGFDWPLLVSRFRLHGSAPPPIAGHLDLLPVARQLWRHRLADARLASVEAGVAGVRRRDDLPGALVPAHYFAFLRTGDPAPLRRVADHNRLDVISLGLLLRHLADHLADPAARPSQPAGDVAALGRAYRRSGRDAEALACLQVAIRSTDDGLRDELLAEQARLLRRLGRMEDSLAAWIELAHAGGPLAAIAWIQVAKHHEHIRRDFSGALAATEHAAVLVERARLLGRRTVALDRDLARRRQRLRGRLARRRTVYSGGSPSHWR